MPIKTALVIGATSPGSIPDAIEAINERFQRYVSRGGALDFNQYYARNGAALARHAARRVGLRAMLLPVEGGDCLVLWNPQRFSSTGGEAQARRLAMAEIA